MCTILCTSLLLVGCLGDFHLGTHNAATLSVVTAVVVIVVVVVLPAVVATGPSFPGYPLVVTIFNFLHLFHQNARFPTLSTLGDQTHDQLVFYGMSIIYNNFHNSNITPHPSGPLPHWRIPKNTLEMSQSRLRMSPPPQKKKKKRGSFCVAYYGWSQQNPRFTPHLLPL